MTEIETRRLHPGEIARIGEIDRSERVSLGYRVLRGELQTIPVDWNIPTFQADQEGDHTIAAQIRFCKGHLSAGACALGAFDGGKLAGIGLMTPSIRPGLAQLAYLHVSREYRRTRVATRLVDELTRFAKDSGARQVYVSATPSESAVGFYRSLGFRLTRPLPELHELEPEDIHMILDLCDVSNPPTNSG